MSKHSWSKLYGWTVCTLCGLVRNYDRPASQCRGAATVTIREATDGEQGLTADELEIAKLRGERDEARAKLDELTRSAESAIVSLAENHAIAAEIVRTTRAERDDLRRELDSERGQRKSDLLQDLAAARVALRTLVDALTAAGPIDTLSRRDLDAAREALGGRS